MAKTDKLEWYGADVVKAKDDREVTAVTEGTNGQKDLRVKTSAKDARIAELTARTKMVRSRRDTAPEGERTYWEQMFEIANHEERAERMRQKLARYESQGDTRPEQVRAYRDRIAYHVGMIAELKG